MLHFAVRHGDWDQSLNRTGENTAAVAHIFDVFCNGNALLKNFDLASEARQTDVVIRKIHGPGTECPGKIASEFRSRGGLCHSDRNRSASAVILRALPFNPKLPAPVPCLEHSLE